MGETAASNVTTKPFAEREGVARRVYAARIDQVVNHVNANLDGDLSIEALARVAGFSRFHFHRQFRTFTGLGIARFVRLIRIRRAALQLAFNAELTITEIALECGFESPDSFGRTFKQVHGQTPSEFRREPKWLKSEVVDAMVRLQETRMNKEVEIVEFPTTRVAAIEYRGSPQHEYSAIRKLVAWRRENGVGPDQAMTIGIHYADPATCSPAEYHIDICVSYDQYVSPNPHGVVAKEIPGGRCARIRHLGPRDNIAEAEYIYREWLPVSGEELRDFPPFFHYVNVGPDVKDSEMITDVYLPLRR